MWREIYRAKEGQAGFAGVFSDDAAADTTDKSHGNIEFFAVEMHAIDIADLDGDGKHSPTAGDGDISGDALDFITEEFAGIAGLEGDFRFERRPLMGTSLSKVFTGFIFDILHGVKAGVLIDQGDVV